MSHENLVETEFTKQSDLDMRTTTNGLTRRSHAALEEGDNSKDEIEWAKSQALLPSSPSANSFRDAIQYVASSGPIVFIFALTVSFFLTLKSCAVFRTSNTMLNFIHVWATITLMILSIMGLMNALKMDL